jgi:hypothetical protein
MKANFERLIGGASSAGLMAKELLPATAQQMPQAMAFAISCVGRRLVLGERTEEEVEAMLDALSPPGTKVAASTPTASCPTPRGRATCTTRP